MLKSEDQVMKKSVFKVLSFSTVFGIDMMIVISSIEEYSDESAHLSKL